MTTTTTIRRPAVASALALAALSLCVVANVAFAQKASASADGVYGFWRNTLGDGGMFKEIEETRRQLMSELEGAKSAMVGECVAGDGHSASFARPR